MRGLRKRGRKVRLTLAAVACLLTVTGAYWVGRGIAARDGGQAVAAVSPTAVATPPGPDVTPPPGATPDTSKEFWYIPYLNAARQSPIFDGTIAGIRIGPSVDPGTSCPGGSLLRGVLADSVNTPVTVASTFVPDGRRDAADVKVGLCDGEAATAEATYGVSPDPAVKRFGGTIQVYRHRGLPIATLSIPTDRWSAGVVSGVPAAVARPILPDIGLGESAVVVFKDGIVTVVHADGIPWAQVLQFAEGLFR